MSAPIFSTMQSSTVRGGARLTEAVADSPRRFQPSERILLGIVAVGAASTVLMVTVVMVMVVDFASARIRARLV